MEPLRKKLRQRQILRETWEAIAAHRNKRTSATSAAARLEPVRKRLRRPQEAITRQQGAHQQPRGKDAPSQSLSVANQESQQQQQEQEQARERQTELQAKRDDADAAGQEKGNPENTIAANVRWRTYRCPACNAEVQSTVVNGKVHSRGHCGRQFRVAAGVVCRSYLHACPTCNTTVETTKPDGRIQKQHKDSTGRLCKTGPYLMLEPVAADSETTNTMALKNGTERRKRRPASTLQCLTLPSEPTRNQLQSAAPMPSKCSTTKS